MADQIDSSVHTQDEEMVVKLGVLPHASVCVEECVVVSTAGETSSGLDSGEGLDPVPSTNTSLGETALCRSSPSNPVLTGPKIKIRFLGEKAGRVSRFRKVETLESVEKQFGI